MIIPDINLLVYAYAADAPYHEEARAWWEACLSNPRPVGLPWAVILGFVRVMSSNVVFSSPMEPAEAIAQARSWLACPQARVVVPGPHHLDVLSDLMASSRAPGRLTTDAHLAALAIETQSELHSNDTDFGRFSGLRWRNPLS